MKRSEGNYQTSCISVCMHSNMVDGGETEGHRYRHDMRVVKYCFGMSISNPTEVELFTQYLKIQSDYKVLTMDPWMSFYWFYDSISFQDPSKYKLELAWPLIVDDFVEWIR